MAKTAIESAHVFVTHGELMQRWQEAFRGAVALSLDELGRSKRTTAVWVPRVDGISVAQQLAAVRERLPRARLIVLSDVPNDDEALAAFAAGARGYCNSHAAALLLRRVAGVVEEGGLWIGPSLMQRLLRGVAAVPLRPTRRLRPAGTLTARDLEVGALMTAGASHLEMAGALGVSGRTVRLRAAALMAKVGVRDRLQLALALNRQAAAPSGMAARRIV